MNNSYKINGARTGQNLFLLNGAPISDHQRHLATCAQCRGGAGVQGDDQHLRLGRTAVSAEASSIRRSSRERTTGTATSSTTSATRSSTPTIFQNNSTGQPKPKHNQHQYGGVFGGPIRKDKDFRLHELRRLDREDRIPNLCRASRRSCCGTGSTSPTFGIQDLRSSDDACVGTSRVRRAAFCTVTGRGAPSFAIRSPNNVIPADRLSPIGQKISRIIRSRAADWRCGSTTTSSPAATSAAIATISRWCVGTTSSASKDKLTCHFHLPARRRNIETRRASGRRPAAATSARSAPIRTTSSPGPT